MKTLFINQLPDMVQISVWVALQCAGLSKKDINVAMCSRLCDLADTIDIQLILKEMK